ncbi:hypothetical protein Asd1617_06250 (plasmid) [Shigella dysenteriae 1617]|uniref:Uncharacterized protein n=1 Tax=Shigella dysenteriae 1617 TaxID=754093 RepID=A0A0A7A4B6_SHIDY|nr:hypothetical protein Asd1617_06250 [Shigella dysenteriae 1617]
MRFSTIVSVVTLVWGISPRQPSGKISSDGCDLKKEQMVVSAIASTPHPSASSLSSGNISRQPSGKNIIRWLCLKKRTNGSVRYCQYTSPLHRWPVV